MHLCICKSLANISLKCFKSWILIAYYLCTYTYLDADDGSRVLEVKKMEKKDSNFSYDSIFTYADESKKYDTGKNTFNSAFQYNSVS